MAFSIMAKQEARIRQNGRCAVCGDNLDDLYEHAHHIEPRAAGGRDVADNCAIVCEMCHEAVHMHGNYRSLVVAPQGYFRYLNGKPA